MMISLLADLVTAVIKRVDRVCTTIKRSKTVVYPEHGIQFDPQRGWMTHE
jgi:hypothetical protein